MSKTSPIILFSYFMAVSMPALSISDTNSTNKNQQPLIDSLSINAGYSYAHADIQETNGGVPNVNDIQDQGWAVTTALVFNTQHSDYFKPYLDLAYLHQNDRQFTIPGVGLRHNFTLNNPNFEPFYSIGVGYNYMRWQDYPNHEVKSIDDNGQSYVFTAQTGFDYYITPHFALDLTLRYDGYTLDTTLVENNRVTRIDETYSLSLLVGLVYRFGEKGPLVQEDPDSDHDGISNRYDRCPDTLAHVPVNEAGCPQYRFNMALHYQTAQFKVEQLQDHPTFNTVAFLQKNTQYRVRIIGYSDDIGAKGFNQKLALKRAQEAQNYLTEHGITADRVKLISRGGQEYFIDNDSAESRSENRRILIEFYRNPEVNLSESKQVQAPVETLPEIDTNAQNDK